MNKGTVKPLNRKAYGHIGHLPGSRMTPMDHHIHEGQKRICTEKTRDKHDQVIVQEKLDGSCVAIAHLIDGSIVALGRSGYLAQTSKYEMHQRFSAWVRDNEERFRKLLFPGERLVGEWLIQAHGTRYSLPHEPFVAFDIMRPIRKTNKTVEDQRIPWAEFYARVSRPCTTPRLIHVGSPLSIEDMLKILEPSGHGAIDPVEGAVWRVERDNAVDFLAKWVRPDKVDGKYLPEMSKQDPVWNTWKDSI